MRYLAKIASSRELENKDIIESEVAEIIASRQKVCCQEYTVSLDQSEKPRYVPALDAKEGAITEKMFVLGPELMSEEVHTKITRQYSKAVTSFVDDAASEKGSRPIGTR